MERQKAILYILENNLTANNGMKKCAWSSVDQSRAGMVNVQSNADVTINSSILNIQAEKCAKQVEHKNYTWDSRLLQHFKNWQVNGWRVFGWNVKRQEARKTYKVDCFVMWSVMQNLKLKKFWQKKNCLMV